MPASRFIALKALCLSHVGGYAQLPSKKGARALCHSVNLASCRVGLLNSPEKPLMLPHTKVPDGSPHQTLLVFPTGAPSGSEISVILRVAVETKLELALGPRLA